jgi:hypothetical protein
MLADWGFREGDTNSKVGGPRAYNDKKENQIFLKYKKIQNGAVAKS